MTSKSTWKALCGWARECPERSNAYAKYLRLSWRTISSDSKILKRHIGLRMTMLNASAGKIFHLNRKCTYKTMSKPTRSRESLSYSHYSVLKYGSLKLSNRQQLTCMSASWSCLKAPYSIKTMLHRCYKMLTHRFGETTRRR